LRIHRETREVPAYALVVGKNGHKLQESSADAPGKNGVRSGRTGLHMEASRGTMELLASQLSHSAGRPVVDKTGLTGYYAFTFDWMPANATPESDPDTPSMFTAIQEQLGLKLEPTKAPREILVIDHAEKPSEN
ncbi:MAG TPA: TIGR03435 family protein, partial [Bryobacteraceae bacterium]|nr:TIGR03435 family protein [Bryobacteraceae bacterium]